MPIQLKPSNQAYNIHNKGNQVPAWFGDYANKNKWDYDGVPADGPTNGFYHMIDTSATNAHTYLQYGQNTKGWASARFFDEQVIIDSQTANDNGSIHVKGHVDIGPIGAYRTDDFKAGVPVIFTVKINGVVVHNHVGSTGDEYLELAGPKIVDFDVAVGPQQESNVSSITLDFVYPGHDYPDAHFILGTALYNPTPPSYIPMAIRKSGSNKSLNSNGGFIRIRKSGSFVDKSEENSNTSMQANQGHNRIRRSGTWLQLPKM